MLRTLPTVRRPPTHAKVPTAAKNGRKGAVIGPEAILALWRYPNATHSDFLGSVSFAEIHEVAVSEGFIGERGGTRTHDPMIKSYGMAHWPSS
jgi:hypothetical protein